jgi:hypothetical protein
MPVKDTAMPVCPIHHRANTKAAVNGIFYSVLHHTNFIRRLTKNANAQRILK